VRERHRPRPATMSAADEDEEKTLHIGSDKTPTRIDSVTKSVRDHSICDTQHLRILEQTLAIILPSAMPTVHDSNVCKVGPQGVGETPR
jgi:hypothetical protein